MRLGAFELNEPLPELKAPHALAMLQPWVDVGSVGTLTLSWLESCFGAKEIARLVRPGNFFDFTRYRPTIYSKEGRRQVAIPNSFVTYSQLGTGHDLLFLHLLEPHIHGETYADSIVRLLAKLGVQRYCLIGSMYDYVPHTRPLLVTGGAFGKDAETDIKKMGIESSDYQGPTTIVSIVPQLAFEMGIETMSMIVHLPQYTQLDEDYAGAVRLIGVLNLLYSCSVDENYVRKADQQLRQVNLELETNPQLKEVVEQLEERYEARTKRKKEENSSHLSPEIEKFLSDIEKRFGDNQ